MGQSPSLPSTLPDSHHHDKLQPGKYVAYIYDKEWYVGRIIEQFDEQNDVLIDGMKCSYKLSIQDDIRIQQKLPAFL